MDLAGANALLHLLSNLPDERNQIIIQQKRFCFHCSRRRRCGERSRSGCLRSQGLGVDHMGLLINQGIQFHKILIASQIQDLLVLMVTNRQVVIAHILRDLRTALNGIAFLIELRSLQHSQQKTPSYAYRLILVDIQAGLVVIEGTLHKKRSMVLIVGRGHKFRRNRLLKEGHRRTEAQQCSMTENLRNQQWRRNHTCRAQREISGRED